MSPTDWPSLQVRKADQLPELQGLVIPGGESTTMALIAERWNLVRRRWRAAFVVGPACAQLLSPLPCVHSCRRCASLQPPGGLCGARARG